MITRFIPFNFSFRTISCCVGTKVDIFISILWFQRNMKESRMKVFYHGCIRQNDRLRAYDYAVIEFQL